MIALDTNVLVRLLVGDDESQSAVARALVEQAVAESARLFVSDLVLCELAWVLQRGYRVPRSAVATFDGAALADAGFVHPDPARWPEDVTLHERPPRHGGRRRVPLGS